MRQLPRVAVVFFSLSVWLTGCGGEMPKVSEESLLVKERYEAVRRRVYDLKDRPMKPEQMVEINKLVTEFNEVKLLTIDQNFATGEVAPDTIVKMNAKLEVLEKKLAAFPK